MTIMSMPPVSSHFADSPVPAPPPISGRPAAIFVRKASSSACLAMRGMGAGGGDRRDVAPGGDEGGGERLVVDVLRQLQQPALGAGAEVLLDGAEQRAVGAGVVERLAGSVERRD